MTFRCKIALALVCLLALLFGGGSSALIGRRTGMKKAPTPVFSARVLL